MLNDNWPHGGPIVTEHVSRYAGFGATNPTPVDTVHPSIRMLDRTTQYAGSVLDNPEVLGRPPLRDPNDPSNPYRGGYGYSGPGGFGAKRITYVKKGADGILRGFNGYEGMGDSIPVAQAGFSGLGKAFGAFAQDISTTITTLTSTLPTGLWVCGGIAILYFVAKKKKRRK